jgi:hypothetical protein
MQLDGHQVALFQNFSRLAKEQWRIKNFLMEGMNPSPSLPSPPFPSRPSLPLPRDGGCIPHPLLRSARSKRACVNVLWGRVVETVDLMTISICRGNCLNGCMKVFSSTFRYHKKMINKELKKYLQNYLLTMKLNRLMLLFMSNN